MPPPMSATYYTFRIRHPNSGLFLPPRFDLDEGRNPVDLMFSTPAAAWTYVHETGAVTEARRDDWLLMRICEDVVPFGPLEPIENDVRELEGRAHKYPTAICLMDITKERYDMLRRALKNMLYSLDQVVANDEHILSELLKEIDESKIPLQFGHVCQTPEAVNTVVRFLEAIPTTWYPTSIFLPVPPERQAKDGVAADLLRDMLPRIAQTIRREFGESQ